MNYQIYETDMEELELMLNGQIIEKYYFSFIPFHGGVLPKGKFDKALILGYGEE